MSLVLALLTERAIKTKGIRRMKRNEAKGTDYFILLTENYYVKFDVHCTTSEPVLIR